MKFHNKCELFVLYQSTKDRVVNLFETIHVLPLDVNIVKNKKNNSNIKLRSHLVPEVNVHFYTFFVMKRRKKRAGMCETASCLSHFIHPSAPIRGKYPNTHRKKKLTTLFITGRQVRSIFRGSKATDAYLLLRNDFENVEFYAVS